ncbi:uncharacterized protein LOC133927039 [Phragmites australis]|uniref:uncharacterized protein LOC133927039 n=1 Tax=Phragmites australis TaxID=29695 RepID=UPI002D7A14F2|nr:uncharacterized protein LOC133927039 [Phragmites australis]
MWWHTCVDDAHPLPFKTCKLVFVFVWHAMSPLSSSIPPYITTSPAGQPLSYNPPKQQHRLAFLDLYITFPFLSLYLLLIVLAQPLSVHTSMREQHGMSPSTMRAHRDSHTTSTTTRPKIKIIHIIAPEIIKTDVANFRELVQRLTGKPDGASTVDMAPPVEEEKEMTKKRLAPAAVAYRSDFTVQQEPSKKRKIKCEVKVEEGGFGDYDLDRNELWMDLNPGGFLSFLEEADVFQGMATDDFLQPLVSSSRMDLVGEMYAS